MPYREFRERLGDFGIFESDTRGAKAAIRLGCRSLYRDMMGFGTPTMTIRVESESAIIQVAEQQHVLRIFGVAELSFAMACQAAGGKQ
jgi:hypothetical protein